MAKAVSRSPLPTYSIEALRGADASAQSAIEFTAGGQTFTIPPVELWPDDAFEAMPDEGSAVNPKLIVNLAKALLGPDYTRFKAAGGRAMDIMLLLGASAEKQGVALGE